MRVFKQIKYLSLFISIGFLLTACAASPTLIEAVKPYQQATQLASGQGWWYARFRLKWPEGKQPNWSLGTLVAGEIITPVLTEFRPDIELWRFHRRAARDGHDHVFSFIFYSSAETASQIYQRIDQGEILQQLKDEDIIVWTGYDNTKNNKRPEISGTSDPSWPDEIQKTWPAYIMGASQMWLELIAEYDQKIDADIEITQRYNLIQKQLNNVWLNKGRHAWLHHLNGLFAYQPLLMRY